MFFKAAILTVSSDYICSTENHHDGFPIYSQKQPSVMEFLGKINSKYTTMDVAVGIFLNFSEQLISLGNFLCDL